ncbi:unnamed protein product [Ectocarpus sp. 13 AM-2016]
MHSRCGRSTMTRRTLLCLYCLCHETPVAPDVARLPRVCSSAATILSFLCGPRAADRNHSCLCLKVGTPAIPPFSPRGSTADNSACRLVLHSSVFFHHYVGLHHQPTENAV